MAWKPKNTATNIVFDLETVAVPMTPEIMARRLEDYKPPANYKDPVKIEAHRKEFIESVEERHKFRVGGCRIVSAAFGEIVDGDVVNIQGKCHEDPAQVVKFAVDYLDEYPEYRLIGYNILGFDLPQLMFALHKYNLRLRCPQSKWAPIDMMDKWRGYGMKELAESFGIPTMKDEAGNTLDGGAVGGLFDLGALDVIEAYNKHDVLMEGHLFLAMSRVWSFV